MTCDERIEKTLNRAGQTISDLPKASEYLYAHSVNNPEVFGNVMKAVCEFNEMDRYDYYRKDFNTVKVLVDYVMHLTDVIDRFEWALENQVTLHENLMHVIGNADIPDGVIYDHFCLVVDSIYKAVQTAQEGWENYEEGFPKDGSVDDDL